MVSRNEPSRPPHRSASPQLVRVAWIAAEPGESATNVPTTVPRPEPGIRGGLESGCAATSVRRSTLGLASGANRQYVLWSVTCTTAPTATRIVVPFAASLAPTVGRFGGSAGGDDDEQPAIAHARAIAAITRVQFVRQAGTSQSRTCQLLE